MADQPFDGPANRLAASATPAEIAQHLSNDLYKPLPHTQAFKDDPWRNIEDAVSVFSHLPQDQAESAYKKLYGDTFE